MALCPCGCGGQVKEGRQWLQGHNNWRGPKKQPGHRRVHKTKGYVLVYLPDHPRADKVGEVREHRLVAETALGRPIDTKHPIHHVNGDKTDNRPCNLVVCEDTAYHELLHRRQRALDACGHADWVRCELCGEFDDPQKADMWLSRKCPSARHRVCHNRDARERLVRHANGLRRCAHCRTYSQPETMIQHKTGAFVHPDCKRSWSKNYSHLQAATV